MRLAAVSSLIVTTLLFAGCNLAMPGTTAAYDKCYKALRAQNLEDNASRISCINSNQKNIDRGLSGTAAPYKYEPTHFNFEGSVANDSSDLVITSFKIVVTMPDGKQFSKTFQNDFIQPQQSQPFLIYDTEMKGVYFTDFTNNSGGTPNWTWYVTPLTGLTISTY
jgi:hypothetical protein